MARVERERLVSGSRGRGWWRGLRGRGWCQGREGEVGVRVEREKLVSGSRGRGWCQGREGEVGVRVERERLVSGSRGRGWCGVFSVSITWTLPVEWLLCNRIFLLGG